MEASSSEVFQFHKVQLKDWDGHNNRSAIMFQFHKVQLKVQNKKRVFFLFPVSIP